MSSNRFRDWARSQIIGGIAEIAILTPIKKGRIPGQRQTYEERLRFTVETIAKRAREGTPNLLSSIPTIHFGRLVILRPEQYLLSSEVAGVDYYPQKEKGLAPLRGRVPRQMDEYKVDGTETKPNAPTFASHLMTIVTFDGGGEIYGREVVEFIEYEFDQVFRNCEDYPLAADFDTWWTWVRRHQIPVDLFYASEPDLSLPRIKQLAEFKDRFDAFVAKVRPSSGPAPSGLETLFDEFLRETQQFSEGFPGPGGIYTPGKNAANEGT